MKTTIKTAFSLMLLFSALAAVVSASPLKVFSIENLTSFDVGTVTIVNDDGDRTKVDVSGSGEFTATIHGKVDKVIINHQSINRRGGPVDVTLDSGFIVQVDLSGDQIVVTDQNIVSGVTKIHGR